MTKAFPETEQHSTIDDPLDFSFSEQEISALAEGAQAAVAPASPTARALRIAAAKSACEAVRSVASSLTHGREVATAEEFVAAVLALPGDDELRRHALNSAQARVKARTDLSAKVKFIFIEIAQLSMGKYRHCFSLAEMIGLNIGIRHTSDISRSVTKLAELGLIFTYHDGQRLFTVPAMAEVDRQVSRVGKGTQPAFVASRLKAANLISKANVCYPLKAVKIAIQSNPSDTEAGNLSFDTAEMSNDRGAMSFDSDMVSIDTKSAFAETGLEGTPIVPVDTLSSATPLADANTSSVFRETDIEIQEATASTRPLAASDGIEDNLTGKDVYTPAKMSREQHVQARELTTALTAVEIARDYARYFASNKTATWPRFLRGLEIGDNKKRESVARRLGDRTNAFLKWDRNTNGNAKETLGQRISRFNKLPRVPDPQRRGGSDEVKHEAGDDA